MALKISITGHRKLEDSENVRKKICIAIENILKSKNEKIFEAYSCLASGSDSIFAEVALQMGGTLKAVLPMPASEYLQDFDTTEARLFNELLSNDSNPVIIVDKIPVNSDERNEAYLKAGEFIVNECNVLIAVWDGEKSSGKGGTGDIVEYARKSGKQVNHIKAFRSDISRLFLKYDKKAILYKAIYEWLWKFSIILSLSAALILAAYLSFHLETHAVVLAKIEFLAVLIALGIILYLKWGKLNKDRVAFRRAAERFRVIERFDNSGINIEKLAFYEGIPEDVTKLEEKYQAISYPQNNFEKSRTNILHLVNEQILYHSSKRPEIKGKTFHFLESIQFPLLIFFLLGVSFHFVAVLIKVQNEHLYHILHPAGLMLSLSIPPIYAAIEGYIYFKEYHKIFTDSEKMKTFFQNINEAINEIETTSSSNFTTLNNYAFQIMKNMDAETKEWSVWFGRPRTPGP